MKLLKLKFHKIEKRTKPGCRVASPILPEITFYLQYIHIEFYQIKCTDINEVKIIKFRRVNSNRSQREEGQRRLYRHGPLGLNTAKRRPTNEHQGVGGWELLDDDRLGKSLVDE